MKVKLKRVLPPEDDFINFTLFVFATSELAGFTLYFESVFFPGIQTQANASESVANGVPVTS